LLSKKQKTTREVDEDEEEEEMKLRRLFLPLVAVSCLLPSQLVADGYSPAFLKALEQRLLQMFELPAVPTHIKSVSAVPSVFKHMYDFLEGDEESHFELDEELAAKVNRVVHHPEIHNYPLGDNLHHLKFNYGLHDHGGVAHRTELLLHTELMSNNTIVNLYKLPHTNDVMQSERVLLDSLRIELGGKIERFDVTDHIEAIGAHGLLVEVANGESDHLRMRRSTQSEFDDSPTLVSYVDDGSAAPKLSRTRRRSRNKNRNKNRTKQQNSLCQRHELYVDFKTVEWHQWIVAPVGYKAYVCEGQCSWPMDDHLNATNHAIFNSFVHMLDPTETDGACCIPTKLSSLHLLYLDREERAVLKAYENMVVDECGCR